jgi:hypothetical protein
MTLYILTTDNPMRHPYYHSAYTDKDMAEHVAWDVNHNTTRPYAVKEIDVPFAGKHLYWLHVYYGFVYGYHGIHDKTEDSNVYPCKAMVNEDPISQKILSRIKADGDDKYVFGIDYKNDPYMASKDRWGDAWSYGEACEGKFSATYNRIRVVRETYFQYRQRLDKFLRECYN